MKSKHLYIETNVPLYRFNLDMYELETPKFNGTSFVVYEFRIQYIKQLQRKKRISLNILFF